MQPFCVKLQNRGRMRIGGPDRRAFLQPLITNNVDRAGPQTAVYACLLTPQGRFLHDFFITTSPAADELWLECEGGARAHDLARRLSAYKLRRNVTIEAEDTLDVYALWPAPQDNAHTCWPDPRHPGLGARSFERPDLPEKPFEEWDRLRIALCVPDGSRDLIPERSTLDEGGMDALNAIDYTKGCYIGQEITARVHYRGLSKKQLRAVSLADLPPGAELRSRCGEMALALVRTEKLGADQS